VNHFFADAHDFAGARRVIASILELSEVLSPYPGHFSAPWKGAVFSVGEIPTRQLSFQPVATGAVVEATKRSKPSV
jgi:hypothetical protein